MKLKLDANLGTRGHRLLVEAGHDVSTAEVQNLARAPDETVSAVCAAEGRALVTSTPTSPTPCGTRRRGTPASSSYGRRRRLPRVTSKPRSERYSEPLVIRTSRVACSSSIRSVACASTARRTSPKPRNRPTRSAHHGPSGPVLGLLVLPSSPRRRPPHFRHDRGALPHGSTGRRDAGLCWTPLRTWMKARTTQGSFIAQGFAHAPHHSGRRLVDGPSFRA